MKYCIFLFTLLTLSACTNSKWVSENGLRVDSRTLSHALNRCDFEKRRKEALTYLSQLEGKPASMPILEAQVRPASASVDTYIIECMARKGFTLS